MNLIKTKRPKSKQQMELDLKWQSEISAARPSVEELIARHETQHSKPLALMERVVEKTNMQKAYRRVKKNKGSAGIDGMEVGDLKTYLTEHWQEIKEQLLAGTYQPQAVRKVEIPKPQGGIRQLGIPTVVDRGIQQAILQILQPKFDPTFSEHSHGFRPNRSAHEAIREAQGFVRRKRTWVVDIDLEKFFDRVNHDVLMNRLSRRICETQTQS